MNASDEDYILAVLMTHNLINANNLRQMLLP